MGVFYWIWANRLLHHLKNIFIYLDNTNPPSPVYVKHSPRSMLSSYPPDRAMEYAPDSIWPCIPATVGLEIKDTAKIYAFLDTVARITGSYYLIWQSNHWADNSKIHRISCVAVKLDLSHSLFVSYMRPASHVRLASGKPSRKKPFKYFEI